MHDLELLSTHEWSLAHLTGFTHPFFTLNAETIINTWIVVLFLLILFVVIRLVLHYSTGFIRFCIVRVVHAFVDLCEQNLETFSFKHFTFITALFVFIFACNVCAIVPWLEEPTRDLNTTLALSIISFLYIQANIINHKGMLAYIGSYFKPIFLLLPLNIIGKMSSILSISFRLFGNIFGGSLIAKIYFTALSKWWLFEVVGLILGINLLINGFFILFEGTLQAFVFTMIVLTYISLSTQSDGH